MKPFLFLRKTRLSLMALAMLICLSSCSNEAADIPDVTDITDTELMEIEDRSHSKPQYGNILFYPHKGKHRQQGVTAEFLPDERKILVIADFPIQIIYDSIEIVENPDCGWVNSIQNCNYHFNINLDEAFVQCLVGRQQSVYIGFNY